MVVTNCSATTTGGGIHATTGSKVNISGSVVVHRNIAGTSGGGIYLHESSKANLTGNVMVMSNTATKGAGLAVAYGSLATLAGSTSLTQNAALSGEGIGGGLHCSYYSQATCSESASIEYNDARYGAGVYLDTQSQLELGERVSVSHNTAGFGAGAVYVLNAAKLIVRGSRISKNIANSGGGGALFVGFEGELDIDGMTSDYNWASQSGGVLSIEDTSVVSRFTGVNGTGNQALRGGVAYINGGGSLTTQTCNFVKNTANYGGCFYVDANAMFVSENDIHSNSSSISGPGAVLFAALYSTVKIANSRYESGKAAGAGGALYIELARKFTVVDSTFLANTAFGNGGAVYVSETQRSSTLTGCIFEKNKGSSGGSLYVENSVFRVTQSTFLENTASTSGGGVYLKNSRTTFAFCSVQKNAAVEGSGGAIYMLSSVSGLPDLMLNETDLTNNYASISGGGILSTTAHIEATHTNFSSNTAVGGSGGALGLYDSVLQCLNCSVALNLAKTAGGGMSSTSSTIELAGSVLTKNVVTSTDGKGGALALTEGSSFVSGWEYGILFHGRQHSANQLVGNNCSGRGGALYLSASTYRISNYTVSNYSVATSNVSSSGDVFVANNAGVAGGALFWNWNDMNRPIAFDSSAGSFNKAPCGDEAATPVKSIIAIHSPDTEENSGGYFATAVVVNAYDYYEQAVPDEMAVTITTDSTFEGPARTVYATTGGETTKYTENGRVEFGDMSASLKPGTKVSLTASLTATTPEDVSIDLDSTVSVRLRQCIVGEEKVEADDYTKACVECGSVYKNKKFSFGNASVCEDCPLYDGKDVGIKCRGAQITLPNDYWRDTADSTLIRKCTLVGACVKGAKVGINDTNNDCSMGHKGPMCGQVCAPLSVRVPSSYACNTPLLLVITPSSGTLAPVRVTFASRLR